MWLYRRISKVSWTQHVTKPDVLDEWTSIKKYSILLNGEKIYGDRNLSPVEVIFWDKQYKWVRQDQKQERPVEKRSPHTIRKVSANTIFPFVPCSSGLCLGLSLRTSTKVWTKKKTDEYEEGKIRQGFIANKNC